MYTTINNQQIYYQKIGKGKDLVIVHGWGQDVSSFWSVAEKLKDDFTLWLIDLPGFGRSELPKKDFTNQDYADVIKGFVEHLKLKKPFLLGHSVGGRVSIKLLAQHPDLFEKAIFEDAAGIKPKQDGIKPFLYLGAKTFNLLVPNIGNVKEKMRYRFYKGLEADYINAGEMKGTLTNLLDEDLTAELPKIQTEMLLIWGENDLAVPLSDGKKMYRLIPNARIEVFDNVGHFPHLENEKLFVHIVTDYLSS
jgi:pimeloyl-ACP methyl ester carboxylesterase